MKLNKLLTVPLMASALLFGVTACADNSVQAGPGVDQSTGTADGDKKTEDHKTKDIKDADNVEKEAKADIADTVNGLYAYVYDDKNIEDLLAVTEGIDTKDSDDDKIAAELKKASPETFSFFHTHDTQTIVNAFGYIAQLSVSAEMASTDLPPTTPDEAITVDGDTATVEIEKLAVEGDEAGAPTPNLSGEVDTEIDLVKKDGKWLVDAPEIDIETGERVKK